MKKTSLLLVLMTITVFGQNQSRLVQNKTVINNVENNSIESVPRRISYQGLITKADGSPTEDGSYEVLFRLYNSADGGEPIWSEAQEVSVMNGIISTVLGNTNPFTIIPQEAFLELSVEGSTLSPRQLLTSVFYSILSDTSGYAKTADYNNLINQPDLGQTLLLASAWITMIFVSGFNMLLLSILGLAFIGVIALLIFFFPEKFGYVLERIKTFIDPNFFFVCPSVRLSVCLFLKSPLKGPCRSTGCRGWKTQETGRNKTGLHQCRANLNTDRRTERRMCVDTYVHMYVRTYIRTYIHTYVRT